MSLLTEHYPETMKVYVAKYFYVALMKNGQVYRWYVLNSITSITW